LQPRVDAGPLAGSGAIGFCILNGTIGLGPGNELGVGGRDGSATNVRTAMWPFVPLLVLDVLGTGGAEASRPLV